MFQGQSWDLDHERNLERLNGAARHEINRQSLHHRHLRLGKWLWRVLAKFEMAVNQRQISCVTIIEAHEDYQRFFVYLMCTGRMVLQDALLTYRKHLTSKNFSCVGHADNTDNAFQDEEMHRNIMRLLAGATPSNQRVRRFRAMGYSYLWVKTFAEIDVLAYKKTFRRPLWRIIKAAKPFHALSGFREKWTITSTDAESLQHETPSRLSTGTSHSNDHDAELD